MTRHTLTIWPIAPFRTPLHSDTIFGHLCWALRYSKGDKELVKFISMFSQNDAPFVMSSGFPQGYLPMPLLRPMTVDEEEALWNKYFSTSSSRLNYYRTMKELRKSQFIKENVLLELKDHLCYFDIFDRHFTNPVLMLSTAATGCSRTVPVWRNSINRVTDRVIPGRLFATLETFFNEDVAFSIFIEDRYLGKSLLEEIFKYISRSGYGADKTVGCGGFQFELTDNWILGDAASPNHFMSLSHYFPLPGEFENGFYTTITKFGKLGGIWATDFSGGPHKMPLVMFQPGSTFEVGSVKCAYGGLVRNVHQDQRIVHYGIALPLMVRCTRGPYGESS